MRKSDMQQYFEYGSEKVFFTPDEVLKMKFFGDPGLKLLGFKPRSRLKTHHNVRPSYFVYPDESVSFG